MKGLLCRPGGGDDLDFIRQLSHQVFSRYGDYGAILPAWALEPWVMTIIITEESEPLGFAMLRILRRTMFTPLQGELLAIAVSPHYQGRGIGKKLLAHMESLALQRGLRAINLCTAVDNARAQALFDRAGYEIRGSRDHYYPRGQPALVMGKILDS